MRVDVQHGVRITARRDRTSSPIGHLSRRPLVWPQAARRSDTLFALYGPAGVAGPKDPQPDVGLVQLVGKCWILGAARPPAGQAEERSASEMSGADHAAFGVLPSPDASPAEALETSSAKLATSAPGRPARGRTRRLPHNVLYRQTLETR